MARNIPPFSNRENHRLNPGPPLSSKRYVGGTLGALGPWWGLDSELGSPVDDSERIFLDPLLGDVARNSFIR